MLAAFDYTSVLSSGAGVVGLGWLTVRYVRQVLNSQADRITNIEKAHRRCLWDHSHSESYIDQLRGALVTQGLSIPPRVIEPYRQEDL